MAIPINGAEAEESTIPVSKEPINDPGKGHQKGHRSLSAPVFCMIDFVNRSIEISNDDEIIIYELWNEDGDILIDTFSNEFDMVNYMSNLNGIYKLCLFSTDYIYIGNIEL